ncbi:glycosyltransferase [Psychrobacillus sp. L4]|uniref:glycosyltransferase n=1 Tax=Psychrobacillus sp. L4 TaxID=3236892 RepID=UPI0036F43746
MKVIQINSVCGIGSTGRIATDIHNILIEQGHESYISYGRDNPKNCDTAIKIGTKYDNYTHVALTRIYDKHGFGSKKATMEFIKKVEEFNPDVIHLHNIHGYYINIELLFDYLKKANKPIIWTLHDCWAFTGHCTHFDYTGCKKWKTGCSDCPEKNSYPASAFIDNSKVNYFKKKDIFNGVKNLTIITPSKWLANLVQESYLRDYPVKVINNGIDLNVFQSTKNNFREKNNLEGKFIILGVASIWSRKKGFEYFLELSSRIKANEIIVLVGVTEKQKKLLPKNVLGINKTNNIKELAKIYSAADVFINPTLEDNFPTVNLEALACGTPVITFETGGSVESIDTNSGFIVEKGDIKGLINSIEKVKEQGKLIYSTHCKNRARELYDKSDKFNEYLQEYIQLTINGSGI